MYSVYDFIINILRRTKCCVVDELNIPEVGAGLSTAWSGAYVRARGRVCTEGRLDWSTPRGSHKSAELRASHRGRPLSDVSTERHRQHCYWSCVIHPANYRYNTGMIHSLRCPGRWGIHFAHLERVQQLTHAGNRCHFVLLDKDESCLFLYKKSVTVMYLLTSLIVVYLSMCDVDELRYICWRHCCVSVRLWRRQAALYLLTSLIVV